MKLDLTKTNGTSPPMCDHSSTNYLEVATAQLNRGFKVVPVHPQEKRGVLWNQFRNPATTLSEVMQHAKDFADYNVGVVGVQGVGNHCFLDIDADGVIEKIERETGRCIPTTYAVQSSPNSKPWKRHYYFLQTAYSVARIKKQFNRKDPSKTVRSDKGTLMHRTMYDFKGVGGGGYVVAAGCARKDGETYSVMIDAPVVPIPDWFVDWLVADKSIYLSDRAKAKPDTDAAAPVPGGAHRVPGLHNEDHAFEIAEADIYEFARWRAGTFASLGIERKTIKDLLVQQILRFCAGGQLFIKNHKDTIHKIAFSKGLKTSHANVRWFYRLGDRKKALLKDGFVNAQTRKGLLIEAMESLPDRVTVKQGYRRLQNALRGTGFSLERSKVSQRVVSEVRALTGFTATRTPGGWEWIRSATLAVSTIDAASDDSLYRTDSLASLKPPHNTFQHTDCGDNGVVGCANQTISTERGGDHGSL